MLVVHKVGPGVVPYYVDGPHPGRWSRGAGDLLALEGAVSAHDLSAVLKGCHPETGAFLPEVKPARRRAGWSLVFCAPKSVSVAAASGRLEPGHVRRAHATAVAGVLDRVEDRLTTSWARAEGLIAAAFDHTANAAGEPHVHTHVLLANLTRAGGRWGTVRAGEWTVDRWSLAALYQLALRHEINQRFPGLEWRIRPDGLADLADVSRSAVRSASTQSHRPPSERWAARRGDGRPPPAAIPDPGPIGRQSGGPEVEGAKLNRTVTARLSASRSVFRREDVLVILAACHPAGLLPPAADAWAEGFCAASRPAPSPTTAPRWTTELSHRADERLASLLELCSSRGPDGLVVLASAPRSRMLLAQAEYLERRLAGGRVGVECVTPAESTRWKLLTGWPPPGRAAPEVLVVDQADRRSAAQLSTLAERALDTGSGLVLVEGGSRRSPLSPASLGLAAAGDRHGRLATRPHQTWEAAFPEGCAPRSSGSVGRTAAGEVLRVWASDRPLMVALGPQEAAGLNAAARRILGLGPQLSAGERVIGLAPAAGAVNLGRLGTLDSVSPDGREGRVRWDGRDATAPVRLGDLGPGYAVSARVAARAGGPVALLGPAHSAPVLARQLVATVELAMDGRDRGLAR